MSQLVGGLVEDAKQTLNDEDRLQHFGAQTTVSVAATLLGIGIFTKGGKVAKVLNEVTEKITDFVNPKTLEVLDVIKKGNRHIDTDKALKEFKEIVGNDYIESSVDELLDVAKSDKLAVTIDLWKKLRERGQKFDKKVSELFPPKYFFHQVRVDVVLEVKGKKVIKQYFLDSYQEGVAIVSRKATDFNKIQLKTFEGYCNELLKKYPVGAKITTAKDGYGSIVNKTLQGTPTIEVPKINELSSRLKEFQEIADKYKIKLVFEAE